MRTAIFVGLLFVADAINKSQFSEEVLGLGVLVFCMSVVMDILDFIHKHFPKK